MTIAAGFRCIDGVAMCSDSEHTAGQTKFYDKKIFDAHPSNGTVFIAGAGDYVYIRSAADQIASSIYAKTVSFEQVKAEAEDAVSEVYVNHITAARQAGDPNPTLFLLLAAYIEGEKQAKLYRVMETGSVSPVDSGIAAIGNEAAEAVLRAYADLFFRDYMSVFAVRHLARYIVRKVLNSASYCGGSQQIACLTNGGISYLDNSASADPGPDYLSDLLWDLPMIIEECICPATEEGFKAPTERLVSKLQEAREKRKKYTIGNDPIETNGWSW